MANKNVSSERLPHFYEMCVFFFFYFFFAQLKSRQFYEMQIISIIILHYYVAMAIQHKIQFENGEMEKKRKNRYVHVHFMVNI